MSIQRLLIIILFFVTSAIQLHAQDMTNARLEKIISSLSDTIIGQNGAWEFRIGDLPMICITDENHNRMRIVAPIAEMKDITVEQMKTAMEANFHSALDVKYAISDEVMWVVYIHPLKELQNEQTLDAIRQVYNAVLTFGTSYTSTELSFPKTKKEKRS